MTAIELLNRIYNGDAEFSEDLELVERYARLQIEKDRERVKANVKIINIGGGFGCEIDLESIDQTPINLD